MLKIKHKKELKIIPLDNITHITCDSYLSTIHMLDSNQKICIFKLLKEFEKELADKGFVRINHNALANINSICSYNYEKRFILFKNNEKCRVSTRKLKNLKGFLKN